MFSKAFWHRRGGACDPSMSDGPHRGHHGFGHHRHHPRGMSGGPSFGVRRPLRFLSHKLGLSKEQVGELAAILSELKTERAQASVDRRRVTNSLAETISGDTFDAEGIVAASKAQVESAERLQGAVAMALERVHALLNAEQRQQLAQLIRAGAVMF